MGDLKPIGSEKLTGMDKITRIMEIARYGEVEKNTENHVSTTSFTKQGSDGNTYAIVQERDGYYLKSGINESELDYIDGLQNKRKNRFKSYGSALKRMNLIFKPLNEEFNNGEGLSMYNKLEEQCSSSETVEIEEDDKFVLNVPNEGGDEEVEDVDFEEEMGDEELDFDTEDELGDEELDLDAEVEDDATEEDMEGFMKSIQKLTGKLGQKLRDTEDDMESEDIKYVVNSILSALDLDKLDEEDKEDIMDRFEDDETEYGDEEVEDVELGFDDVDGEEVSMDDMGDEEMEVEDEEIPMESIKKDKSIISEQGMMKSLLRAIVSITKDIKRRIVRGKKDLTPEQLTTLTMLIALPPASLTALGVGVSTLKMWKGIVKAKGQYEAYKKLSDTTVETTPSLPSGNDEDVAMESLKNRVSNLLESYMTEQHGEPFPEDPREGETIVGGLLGAKSFSKDTDGNMIELGDSWETLLDNTNGNIRRIDLVGVNDEYRPLHSEILNSPNIESIHLENIVNSVPEEIGQLKNLEFLSLPNNPELTSLPDSIMDLPKLMVLNVKNSPVVLSDALRQHLKDRKVVFIEKTSDTLNTVEESKKYLKSRIKNLVKKNNIKEHCSTIEQELGVKKFIKENSEFKLNGTNKNGSIVLSRNNKKVLIGKNGEVK